MKRFFGLCLLIGMVLSIGTGCINKGAGITGSTLPIRASDSYTVIGEGQGSSTAIGLGGMQIWPTSAYWALQDAKKASGADGLINVTAENKVYYLIPPIFTIITIHRLTVQGDAIKFERGGSIN